MRQWKIDFQGQSNVKMFSTAKLLRQSLFPAEQRASWWTLKYSCERFELHERSLIFPHERYRLPHARAKTCDVTIMVEKIRILSELSLSFPAAFPSDQRHLDLTYISGTAKERKMCWLKRNEEKKTFSCAACSSKNSDDNRQLAKTDECVQQEEEATSRQRWALIALSGLYSLFNPFHFR